MIFRKKCFISFLYVCRRVFPGVGVCGMAWYTVVTSRMEGDRPGRELAATCTCMWVTSQIRLSFADKQAQL